MKPTDDQKRPSPTGTDDPRGLRAVNPSEAFDQTIAELQRQNARLELLQAVALASNAPIGAEEALRIVLDRVCEHTGWPVGHVWLPEGDELVPVELWRVDDPDRFQGLVRVTRRTRFRSGQGLPGEVLATRRPAWIRDVAEDPDFIRREGVVPRSEVHGAFAFPALVGDEVVAILEFFSPEPAEPDESLLDLVANLGTVLGRVVERERAAEELRSAEKWLRKVVETAHEAFISIDEDGLVREWNAEAERLFGWSREEAVGGCLSEMIIPPVHREAHERGLRHFLASGEGPVLDRRLELPALHRDGRELPVELTISPLKLGRRFAFNAFLHDISERKRTEAELRRREQALAEAQSLAALGSWEWDLATNEVTWSDQTYRNFGLEPGSAEVDLESYLARVHPDDREMVLAEVQSAAEEQRSFAFEHRLVRPDGCVRTLAARGRMVFDDEGRPVKMIGTGHDVTERKEAERQALELTREQAARQAVEEQAAVLRRRAEQLQGLAEAAVALNAGLSTEEVLEGLAARARTLIGAHQAIASVVPESGRAQAVHAADLSRKYGAWRSDEVRPSLRGLAEAVWDEDRPARLTQAELEAHSRWQGETAGQPPLRGWLAAPLAARTGRNLGLIQLSDKSDGGDFTGEDEAILVQLAQMASAVIENARLYEEAREAARAREEVLAVVSHDLRTPLSVVSTAATVLAEPSLPQERRTDLIERIERAVERMTGLIRDLLDVARLEAGRLVIDAARVEVEPLLDEVCHLFRLSADERSVALSCHVADDGVSAVAGDRDRLLQVLQNLVDNALKFTPEGGSVKLWASSAGASVRFSVADSGPGIPADEVPHLFDRFWQSRGGGRPAGGTGLGLAIVRGIVEAHGGTVWVESEEGRGTTFHFTLPAAPAEAEGARARA